MEFSYCLLPLLPAAVAQQIDWLKEAKKAAGDASAEAKIKQDSLDFQFAISGNENSGVFDVVQKRGGVEQCLLWYEGFQRPLKEELARDSLETAISLYQARWYSHGDRLPSSMQSERWNAKILPKVSTTCAPFSCIGLVYLSQGRTLEASQYH